MPKIKRWTCDRCGDDCDNNPWAAVILQVNEETGEPMKRPLSARMKNTARMKLCKTCAEDIAGYIMGKD